MNGHSKARLILKYFLLYCICAIVFTLYYSAHFTDFSTYKGDEYIYYFGFIILLTYILFFIIHFFAAKINIANTIFAPLLILFIAIAACLAVLLLSSLEGTPRETFYVYTSIHTVVTYLLIKFLWRQQFSLPD
jgi:hypothetical protein